eukprot:4410088-Alexandrium_andersonii.AAC.1
MRSRATWRCTSGRCRNRTRSCSLIRSGASAAAGTRAARAATGGATTARGCTAGHARARRA